MNSSVEDLVNEVPSPPEDLVTSERRDLETVRHWIHWILVSVDRLNSRFLIETDAIPMVREVVVQNAFLACVYAWNGRPEVGKASLVRTWAETSLLMGSHNERLRSLRNSWIHQAPTPRLSLTWNDSELLAIFNAAVAEHLLAEQSTWQGRQVVRDLVARLGLTSDEVATMFRVPVETLESWESGRTTIPKEKLPDPHAAGTGLSKLLGIFRPERLPLVIRRPAELFDNRPAAEWIISGRMTEVADLYESAPAYQA